MKTLLSLSVLVGLVWFWLGGRALGATAPRRAREELGGLDLAAMIESIADVESGNNPSAVGRAGERGRCQFTEATWRAHTSAPFLLWAPVNCPLTRKVELAHLRWVCGQLLEAGHVLNSALVTAAWRHGVRHAAACIRTDAARRASNLYCDRMDRLERAHTEGHE